MRYRLVANTKLLNEKQLLNDKSSKGGAVLCPTRPPVIEAQPPLHDHSINVLLLEMQCETFKNSLILCADHCIMSKVIGGI